MIITAGKYKGRKILTPSENIARPTLSKVRMGVFNVLYSLVGDFSELSFLDVFGGSGIMGIEALSRGFENVKVFEKNKQAADIIKKNYSMLGIKPDLSIGDSAKLIKDCGYYDVIYIDPPYQSNIYQDILNSVNGRIIVAEHSQTIDYCGLNLLKEKNYGGKFVSFFTNK